MSSTHRGRLATPVVAALAVLIGLAPTMAGAAPPSGGQAAQVHGILFQTIGDDFAGGRAIPGHVLHADDGSVVALTGLDQARTRPDRHAGQRQGLKRGSHVLAVSEGGLLAEGGGAADTGTWTAEPDVHADSATLVADGGTTAPAADTVVAAAPVERRVAVLLFNFTRPDGSAPLQPWTAQTVRDTVFDSATSVNAYYQQVSDGTVALSGDVFGYYTVPASSTCDYSAWASAARTQATAAGVNLADYKYFVYAFPSQSSCGWAGLGSLPGPSSWINGAMGLRTVAHELGHNFGEHHASTARCTEGGTTVEWSTSCTMNEYGDPFSIMGGSTNQHHASARSHLKLLTPVDVPAQGGSYLLVPAADATSTAGPRLLRIPRGNGTYLALEFRQPAPFDPFQATSAVSNGVTLRTDAGHGGTQTRLIDLTPGTTSFTDAPLPAGRSWTDPLSTATVSVGAVSAQGAQVSISYGPDTMAPTAVSNLKATSNPTGTSVALTWTAATDNRGVAGYRVTRNSAPQGTVATTSLTDGSVSPSTAYTYSVVAVDAAGNVGPATAVTVTTATPDSTAPSPVSGLTASVAENRTVKLSWKPASDNVGVTGYVVSRNGVTVGTTSSLSFSQQKVMAGTYTYTVQAQDAAGNLGSPAQVVAVVR